MSDNLTFYLQNPIKFYEFFASKYGFLLWVFSKNMGDYGFFAHIWERFKIIWDVAGLIFCKNNFGG